MKFPRRVSFLCVGADNPSILITPSAGPSLRWAAPGAVSKPDPASVGYSRSVASTRRPIEPFVKLPFLSRILAPTPEMPCPYRWPLCFLASP